MALGGMFSGLVGGAHGQSNMRGVGVGDLYGNSDKTSLGILGAPVIDPAQIAKMIAEQQANTRRYSTTTDPMADNARRKMMIWSRWHLPDGETIPFPFLETHLAGDKVFVFVVRKDHQYAVFEDEAVMYPSDALMTQLRAVA